MPLFIKIVKVFGVAKVYDVTIPLNSIQRSYLKIFVAQTKEVSQRQYIFRSIDFAFFSCVNIYKNSIKFKKEVYVYINVDIIVHSPMGSSLIIGTS